MWIISLSGLIKTVPLPPTCDIMEIYKDLINTTLSESNFFVAIVSSCSKQIRLFFFFFLSSGEPARDRRLVSML